MSPTLPSPPSPPPSDTLVARLLEGLEGLDLTSADGRAGIRALLAEIERLSPGAILQQAATIELRRVGWRRDGPRPDDAASVKLSPIPFTAAPRLRGSPPARHAAAPAMARPQDSN